MTPAERDARLILQGVLLTIASVLALALVGAMFAAARGASATTVWPGPVLAVGLGASMAGAWRWSVPGQRTVLKRHLTVLLALLACAAVGALLLWRFR
jgi:hypothetical protein